MAIASVMGVFGLIIYLFVPIILLVALQVWLCRKSTKLGVILPCIFLALSLVLTFLIAFNMIGIGPRNLIVLTLIFLITNIPTAVFGGIWLHYKGRQDTLNDLKKMRIEDLE